MELNEKDRERISYLVSEILSERNIVVKDEWEGDFSKEHDFEELLGHFEEYLTAVETYDNVDKFMNEETKNKKSYIYGLFDGDEQIDQTSLDEMNENLAWEIMVEDEKRNPKGLSISLIDEVKENDN